MAKKIEKKIPEKIILGCWQNKIYLIKVSERKFQIFASANGFDFQKIRLSQRLFKQCRQANFQRKKERLFWEKTLSNPNFFVEGLLALKKGYLIIYHLRSETGSIRVKALLFDLKDKCKILWSSMEPIWETPSQWLDKEIEFISFVNFKGQIFAYWRVEDMGIFAVRYPRFRLGQQIKISHKCRLKKPAVNPIIKPRTENSWEAFNTFNPAAVKEAGKIHLFYRAQGWDYFSCLGYAASDDGFSINERLDYPVYDPRDYASFKVGKPKFKYVSGGGWGGCEDPRITKINNRLYMTYVAFDGCEPPRIALTSISLKNFLRKRWFWERPVLISPPGVIDKSACIFPEKINGKYVILHRIFPNILVDFVDSLDFDGKTFLKGEYKIAPRSRDWWDSRKIGAGAPPIKTEKGWLLIYQAVDDKDASHYQVGAMLLDLADPTKVLHRSRAPVIKPDKSYEFDGFKAGVVYPCGAVVVKDSLLVYYGAADSYVCVASANLNQLVQALVEERDFSLSPAKIRKINGLPES
jgi:predicted GH43/DUF377 family glycosyl hydrolase